MKTRREMAEEMALSYLKTHGGKATYSEVEASFLAGWEAADANPVGAAEIKAIKGFDGLCDEDKKALLEAPFAK